MSGQLGVIREAERPGRSTRAALSGCWRGSCLLGERTSDSSLLAQRRKNIRALRFILKELRYEKRPPSL